MKKIIYYASPIIIFPIIFFVIALLEKTDVSNALPVLMCIVLFVFAAVMGSLSTTNKRFDYIIASVIAVSCFLALFIGLLFDEGCDGTPQLSFHHALNMEYYKVWLPIVAIITLITFVASFKPIRISKWLWKK